MSGPFSINATPFGIRRLFRAIIVFMLMIASVAAFARPWRPAQIPNGAVFDCTACHVSASGGGARNAFGEAVNALLNPGSMDEFWSATLAAQDSDGDLTTNGAELGDPNGLFTSGGSFTSPQGFTPTNPGDASSKPTPPANTAPAFSSTAVTTGTIGITYSYQATATDTEQNTITFSKVAGPGWLLVSSAGVASGTPGDTDAGTNTVTIRATDNGNPVTSADQTFSLIIAATMEGWKNLHFNLPTENSLAAALTDPDNDGAPNLIEYALRLNPRSNDVSSITPFPIAFDGSDRLQIRFTARSDDPKLQVVGVFSSALDFSNAVTNTGVSGVTNGLRTHTFTDTVTRTGTPTRYGRITVSLLP